MMFCPKCGAILVPKKQDKKKVMACSSCSFINRKPKEAKITEKLRGKERKLEVIEGKELETLPLADTECSKCGHKKAYFWTLQTRAADEPETKFLRCQKCGHTWREYD
jgi:DNA-directed RNA polymerase subunit M